MKLNYFLTFVCLMAIVIDNSEVDAKKKKKKKSKVKMKFKFDGNDRTHVGCEPWKFTFYTFEDSWCQYQTGVKVLDQSQMDAIAHDDCTPTEIGHRSMEIECDLEDDELEELEV